ncbi:hypothetical protein [Aquimarina rhabdastrellae]
MKEKSIEINKQIEYGLEQVEKDKSLKISLKDFMFIYKTIEEFRRFFHNRNHYRTLNSIHTYIGNNEVGAFSILDKLYCKVLDKYFPKEMERLEDKITHPDYPYYYNLKAESKFKLEAVEEIETPIFELIKEMGFTISKIENNWKAENYSSEFTADSPSRLLGLISLYQIKGENWEINRELRNDS